VKPKIVAIGVLADRLDILECQGDRVLSSRRITVTVSQEATEWAKSVAATASSLKEAIEEVGLVGRRAYVVYRSPTETADYVSLKMSSAAQARDAAKIYATNEDGTTTVFKAGDTFEILAVNKLNDYTLASPAVAGEHIFLRTANYLYCFGKQGPSSD
jgi:hypothetical protein